MREEGYGLQATGYGQMEGGDGLRATGYGQIGKSVVPRRVRGEVHERCASEREPAQLRASGLCRKPQAALHKPFALWLAVLIVATVTLGLAEEASSASHTFIVSGLGGEPQYEERFRQQAEEIATIARGLAESPEHVVMLVGAEVNRDAIRTQMRGLAERAAPNDLVTIVLIGHGTYDGEEYRFNIPGQDITGSELQRLLSALRAREQLIVNATSASGATIDKWSQPGRVLITATKSGGERTATRFAQFWTEALKAGNADSNRDEIVTAGEAFEYASRQVAAAFKADVALATEHPRIEGTDAAAGFTVARFGSAASVSSDPEVNALLAQRAALERDLGAIKERKPSLSEEAYYNELESVLVKFAQLQQQIDSKQAVAQGAQP
jgi:hypothetical protein